MVWNKVETKDHVDALMKTFGCFHDSCIKEIRYISGAFVDKDLSMNPVNNMRIVDVVFQRQYENPTVIIVRFIGLNIMQLIPNNDDYTCEIQNADMFINNGNIYWVDCCGVANDLDRYEGTWLSADKIEWIIADSYIGNEEVYINR